MTNEHESQVPKRELEIPGSVYLEPEMLMALEKMERGKPLTWGATPLEPYRPDIAVQQRKVEREIRKRFPKSPEEVPFGLDWETAIYIHGMYDMRSVHRLMRNQESYAYRGNPNPSNLPEKAQEMIERAIRGRASPAEIGATGEIEQDPTIELASVSHLWGKRMEYLPPMRRAIEDGIKLRKGKTLPSNRTYEARHAIYFNREFRKAEPSLLMTRTTEIGEIGEHIKDIERSSFVIILSRLALEQTADIMSIPYGDQWSQRILSLPGFEDAVDKALDKDRYDIAVPMSTTTIEVNERYVEEFLNNEEHRAQRHKEMYPNNYENIILSEDGESDAGY